MLVDGEPSVDPDTELSGARTSRDCGTLDTHLEVITKVPLPSEYHHFSFCSHNLEAVGLQPLYQPLYGPLDSAPESPLGPGRYYQGDVIGEND